MANVTVTTADKWIDEKWSAELNRAMEFVLVLDPLFEDKSSVLPSGDTYHLPSRHNLTANTKSAGSDATPEAITETDQTFAVSTHQITAQEIESIAEVQSRYDARREYTLAATYALARAREVAAAALFDDNTTQTVGTLQSELTDDNHLRALQYLWDAGKYMNAMNRIIGCVSPAGYIGMLKIDKFVNQLYTGDSGTALKRAKVGMIYDGEYYRCQLLVGTAPDASGQLYRMGHFFKIIQKQPKTDTWFSPLAKAWVVATDQIYGMFERQEAVEAAAGTTSSRLLGVRLQHGQ